MTCVSCTKLIPDALIYIKNAQKLAFITLWTTFRQFANENHARQILLPGVNFFETNLLVFDENCAFLLYASASSRLTCFSGSSGSMP